MSLRLLLWKISLPRYAHPVWLPDRPYGFLTEFLGCPCQPRRSQEGCCWKWFRGGEGRRRNRSGGVREPPARACQVIARPLDNLCDNIHTRRTILDFPSQYSIPFVAWMNVRECTDMVDSGLDTCGDGPRKHTHVKPLLSSRSALTWVANLRPDPNDCHINLTMRNGLAQSTTSAKWRSVERNSKR